MRVCLTADWHVDQRMGRHGRRDEVVSFRDHLVAECIASDPAVDLVVHAVDWADPGRDELENQVRIAEDCMALAWAARLGLLTIPGNHDVVLGTRDRSVLTPMQIRDDGVMRRGSVRVSSVPETIVVGGKNDKLFEDLPWFVTAPYPHDTRDFKDLDGKYHSALSYELVRAEASGRRVVVVSHLYLRHVQDDLTVGSETTEMCRGDDCYLPDYAVEAADVVLQGHYHRRQHLWAVASSGGRAEVFIPGSPIRHSFGERFDAEKGFWFVDL